MQPSTVKPPIRLPSGKVSARRQYAVLAASLVASAGRACP
jgi:hypothetical protein